MDEIVGIIFSWQFLLIGLIVAFAMTFLNQIGEALWRIGARWIRRVLKVMDAAAPWLPPFFGAGLGAIPFWPRPGQLQDLPDSQGYFAMIALGLVAGLFYERIWKGVKQAAEARGIDLDLDIPIKEQKKLKRG